MVAGATAGTTVDTILFPLDTLKTRLQSEKGFRSTGGFTGLYKGLRTVVLGSAPTAALFFVTYNGTINELHERKVNLPDPIIHVLAASCGEVVGASLRIPLEVVKQRKQISSKCTTYVDILRRTISKEGYRGLYRGFVPTMAREIPFAAIQFPLWEYFKKQVANSSTGVAPLKTAFCGAVAGGIAAAATTPLDVIKTRIMLAEKEYLDGIPAKYKEIPILRDVWSKKGLKGLFAGTVPRVLWITCGGFIYFGVYEMIKVLCEDKNIHISTESDMLELLETLFINQRKSDPSDPGR